MGNAQIDQACFLAPGNDFDGVAQHFFGAINKLSPVACGAKSIGGEHDNSVRVHALQALTELSEAVNAALDSFFAEIVLIVQPRRQLNFLSTLFQSTYFTLKLFCDHHMKTV